MWKPDISKDCCHHIKLKQVHYFPGCSWNFQQLQSLGLLDHKILIILFRHLPPSFWPFPHTSTKQYLKGTRSNEKRKLKICRAMNQFSFENYVLWLSSQNHQSWLPCTVPPCSPFRTRPHHPVLSPWLRPPLDWAPPQSLSQSLSICLLNLMFSSPQQWTISIQLDLL